LSGGIIELTAPASVTRFLVTNDDGVFSEGITLLAATLRSLGEVVVVAPDREQSASGHALTIHRPLRVRQLSADIYTVDGTPTDCVHLAVHALLKDHPPDLVISGINFGLNLGDDVTYSGTVAGAMEGTLLGIPSIALSQAYGYDTGDAPPWETAQSHGPVVIRELLDSGFHDGTVINVNFPDCEPDAVAGTAFTRQGRRIPDWLRVQERKDGRGLQYFWIGFQRSQTEPEPGSDLAALADRLIAVTPLSLDLTDERILKAFQDAAD